MGTVSEGDTGRRGAYTAWRRVAARLALVGMIAGLLAPPAWAGAYDPGRAARAARGLVAGPPSAAHLAAGVRLRLPLQSAGHGVWRESRVTFGLDLRRTAVFAGPTAALAPARVRPLARLGFRLATPARLELNGVDLAAWNERVALALGEDGDDQARKHRRRKIVKWVLIGTGGLLLVGIVATVIALASSDLVGEFNPPMGSEPGN